SSRTRSDPQRGSRPGRPDAPSHTHDSPPTTHPRPTETDSRIAAKRSARTHQHIRRSSSHSSVPAVTATPAHTVPRASSTRSDKTEDRSALTSPPARTSTGPDLRTSPHHYKQPDDSSTLKT